MSNHQDVYFKCLIFVTCTSTKLLKKKKKRPEIRRDGDFLNIRLMLLVVSIYRVLIPDFLQITFKKLLLVMSIPDTIMKYLLI